MAPDLDAAAEAAVLDAMEEVEQRGLVPVPGAVALVQRLGERQWAVVTSGSRAVATLRLRAVGLPSPSVFVTAEDVSAGKPDPQGYELAASRLGVAPDDCIVLEDSPPGVAAGKAAGMRVLAVLSSHSALALAAADAHLSTLADLQLRPAGAGSTALALEF